MDQNTQSQDTTNGATESVETTEVSRVEALEKELKEQQNKYLYLYADFDNYKKRSIKERSEYIKFGHENLVRELLQVSDNFERALEHTASGDALVTGLKMVNQQILDTLTKSGVIQMQCLGTKFDPAMHEAVGQEKIQDGKTTEEGSIVAIHQKGYTLHGRLLRPARVVVAIK